MAFEKPNYTQTPNLFFDKHLSEIRSLSEMKVTLIVLRATLGWHAKEVELTIAEIMTATGLSNRHVVRGIALALERGTISRRSIITATGKTFAYEANISNPDSVTKGHKPRRGVSDQRSHQKVTESPAVFNIDLKKVKESKDPPLPPGYRQPVKPPEEKYDLPPDPFPMTNDLNVWLAEMCFSFSEPELAAATQAWRESREAKPDRRKRTVAMWRADWKKFIRIYWDIRQRNGNGAGNGKRQQYETAAERNKRNLRESLKRAGILQASGD